MLQGGVLAALSRQNPVISGNIGVLLCVLGTTSAQKPACWLNQPNNT